MKNVNIGALSSMELAQILYVGCCFWDQRHEFIRKELAWGAETAVHTVLFTKLRSFRIGACISAGGAALQVLHVVRTRLGWNVKEREIFFFQSNCLLYMKNIYMCVFIYIFSAKTTLNCRSIPTSQNLKAFYPDPCFTVEICSSWLCLKTTGAELWAQLQNFQGHQDNDPRQLVRFLLKASFSRIPVFLGKCKTQVPKALLYLDFKDTIGRANSTLGDFILEQTSVTVSTATPHNALCLIQCKQWCKLLSNKR